MKLSKVAVNARKRQLELTARSGVTYPFPFSRLDPAPGVRDAIERVFVDRELAGEGATYVLASGVEGCVLLDQALDYNSDPSYAGRMLSYRLSVEATEALKRSGLSVREVARRLGTSVPQLYRLLDPTNTSKSMVQLVSLLRVVGCEVELVVKRPKRKTASRTARGAKAA